MKIVADRNIPQFEAIFKALGHVELLAGATLAEAL
ncbi:MAG: hypothetical protein ACI8XX_002054 [Polaribacter sp.]|jgi:hypothetical protein